MQAGAVRSSIQAGPRQAYINIVIIVLKWSPRSPRRTKEFNPPQSIQQYCGQTQWQIIQQLCGWAQWWTVQWFHGQAQWQTIHRLGEGTHCWEAIYGCSAYKLGESFHVATIFCVWTSCRWDGLPMMALSVLARTVRAWILKSLSTGTDQKAPKSDLNLTSKNSCPHFTALYLCVYHQSCLVFISTSTLKWVRSNTNL